MLAFIAATRVTFCIVHELDRLARNRADDVKIHEALISAGVTLVSATESIDQTPSGMLLHGIMSSIAEFYSRNLATEVTKGLTQKVAQGGTPDARTELGARIVREFIDAGRPPARQSVTGCRTCWRSSPRPASRSASCMSSTGSRATEPTT